MKTVMAAAMKGCAAVVAFVLTVVVARVMGAEQAGLFLFGFAMLAALTSFFRLGLDHVILRLVGSEGVSAVAQKKLNQGLLWVLITSVPFAALMFLFVDVIASEVFNKPELAIVLRWVVLALPAMTLFLLLAFAFQGLHRIVMTVLCQGLGLSALFLLFFSLVFWCWPGRLNAEYAAMLYSLCAFIVCVLALCFWFAQDGVNFSVQSICDKELWRASSNLWAAANMSLLVQWSGVLVAGAYVATEELAYLSAAQRTVMLASFVLMVVNMVVAPRYAKLWREGNVKEVQRLAKLSTRGMIVLVLPVVVFMVTFPEWIMGWFGGGFEQGAALLVVMALGQFVNVATGSVGYLLTMSGHERDFRKVTFFSGPLTIVCAFIFIDQWGVLGAAYATALGLSTQNLLALLMVKRRMGFWPIG